MTDRQASPIIPTKWDALRQPREQYMGPPLTFEGEERRDGKITPEYDAWLGEMGPEFQRRRELRDEWDQAARNAMATGRLSPEHVTAIGYRPEGHERSGDWNEPKWGKWRPLPDQLYHVTTNLPAVLADGRLRSPYELDQFGKARGLGSFGVDRTISLTDSQQAAENIRRAILEGADVASGRLPIERLVEMAKTGEGGEKPWLNAMFGTHDWSTGNPRGLDDLLLGREPCYRHKLPKDHPLQNHPRAGLGGFLSPEDWAEHGFYPYAGIPPLNTETGPKYTEHSVYRWVSPEEKARNAFEWWRNPWAPMRQYHGRGPEDPMFANSDPEWFANLDPSQVGVLALQPVPGAHGYPMGALDEWRIPTGEAVNITGVNGQPYTRTSMSKTANLYKRWVFSPASGEVTLADNDGDPLGVQYHTDLARQLNEPNLVHGYAYRIGDGWRLTDWDSKPVSDPYIIAQVMGALRSSQGSEASEDGSWTPSGDDWTRVHHGLPS